MGSGGRLDRRLVDRRRVWCQGSALALAALLLAGCAARATGRSAAPAAAEEAGTIRKVGTLGFAIVPDRDPGTRYVPERAFPAEFQVDGLRVLFSGEEAPSPEGVRLWGTPYRLATLRRVP
jgi:hypothetical protein